jgi:hypothetical protein
MSLYTIEHDRSALTDRRFLRARYVFCRTVAAPAHGGGLLRTIGPSIPGHSATRLTTAVTSESYSPVISAASQRRSPSVHQEPARRRVLDFSIHYARAKSPNASMRSNIGRALGNSIRMHTRIYQLGIVEY